MEFDSEDFSTNFFSKRAEINPQLSSEDFESTLKFLKQIHEERERSSSPEITKTCVKKRATSKKGEQTKEEKTKSRPNKRGRKKVPEVEKPEEITVADNSEFPTPPLSLAAKRRRNALQKKVKSVAAENEKIFSLLKTPSNNVIENEVIDACEKERTLTILYLTQILRVKYNEDETFSTIFPRVADLLKLNVSEFLLCFKDKNITVDDSPASLNILRTDILECIPYKAQKSEEIKYDENKLLLLFQSSDTKEKTEMNVHKLEKMQSIIEKYSKTRNIPLNQMVFEFDGERIQGTETPQDLDMESGNCIDVRILNAEDKLSRKVRNLKTVVDLTEEEENSCDSDIIFCY